MIQKILSKIKQLLFGENVPDIQIAQQTVLNDFMVVW